jgi:hypothetical protein
MVSFSVVHMCSTDSNTITHVIGRKRAHSPDAKDLDHVQSTDLDDESDPLALKKPPKKQHQTGICLILI